MRKIRTEIPEIRRPEIETAWQKRMERYEWFHRSYQDKPHCIRKDRYADITIFEQQYHEQRQRLKSFHNNDWLPLFDRIRELGKVDSESQYPYKFWGRYRNGMVIFEYDGRGIHWDRPTEREEVEYYHFLCHVKDEDLPTYIGTNLSKRMTRLLERRLSGDAHQIPHRQDLVDWYFRGEDRHLRLLRLVGFYAVVFDELMTKPYREQENALQADPEILIVRVNNREYGYKWHYQNEHYGVWKREWGPDSTMKIVELSPRK